MDKEQSMDLDHLLSNLKNKKKIIKEKKLRLLIEKVIYITLCTICV